MFRTDAENQTTSYTYDAANRRLTETYPDHVPGTSPPDLGYGIVSFTYDGAGRMATKTDQQGDYVTFLYDRAHRLVARQYRTRENAAPVVAGLPTGPLSDADTFSHDPRGQLLTAVSGRYNNTVAFTYDDAGRLASESLTAFGQTYTIGRGYDAASRLTQLTYPDGKVVGRSYSPRDQLTQVSYDGSLAVSFGYDNGGRETTRTFGNGIVTTRAYNADNTTATIDTPGVTSFTYSFDANKNKTAEIIGGAMAAYGFDNTGYDAEDRLASWARNDSNLTQAWNLSLVGDWQQFTQSGTGGPHVIQDRTHGPTHELTAIDSTPLTYDAKGNMTSLPSSLPPLASSLSWDFDNRLVSAVVPAGSPDGIVGTHTYSYDALGRRVSKTIDAAGPNPTTTVFVCLTSPLEHSPYAGQELAEYSAGSAPTAPQIAYICATYIDDPILQINSPSSSPTLLYHHANDLNSRSAITDSTGSVLERYAYAPYGTRLVFDPSAQPLGPVSSFFITTGFTGRRHDGEISLAYYRARYMDSRAGRFISRDPLGSLGRSTNDALDLPSMAFASDRSTHYNQLFVNTLGPPHPNVYEYVGGSPIDGIDPSGKLIFRPIYPPIPKSGIEILIGILILHPYPPPDGRFIYPSIQPLPPNKEELARIQARIEEECKKWRWRCKCKRRGVVDPSCPDFVEGTGSSKQEAEKNAKHSGIPSHCFKDANYGHCDCWREKQ